MMLHVTDEHPEDLKLVADFYHIARPEIIVEFMEEDDWYDARRVEDIMRHNLALNPRLGSYVISRVEVPPEAFQPLEAMPLAVTAVPQAIPATAGAGMAPGKFGTGVTPPQTPSMARPLSLAELPANVHVLSVGYDMSQLGPVVDALARATALIREIRQKELEARQNFG